MSEETLHLFHKNASVFTYEIEPETEFRAIVISDLHIARFHQKSESIQSIIDHLRVIIEQHNANLLFICGDIIHFQLSVRYFDWIEAYSVFETLGIEVHVIPGNHDRWKYKKVYEHYKSKSVNVHLHPDDFIKIVPMNGRKIILGHDVHNDKRVHGTRKVRAWFNSLRKQFSNIIGPNDLLILGHLHEDIVSADGLTKSLMPYSHDLRVFYYSFLYINEDDQIEATFTYQEGSVDTLII